jgi:hypothetical protein
MAMSAFATIRSNQGLIVWTIELKVEKTRGSLLENHGEERGLVITERNLGGFWCIRERTILVLPWDSQQTGNTITRLSKARHRRRATA